MIHSTGIHFKPQFDQHWLDQTGVRTVLSSYLLLICLHILYMWMQCALFLLLYYQNLVLDCKKVPASMDTTQFMTLPISWIPDRPSPKIFFFLVV